MINLAIYQLWRLIWYSIFIIHHSLYIISIVFTCHNQSTVLRWFFDFVYAVKQLVDTNQGVDQLLDCINKIKESPEDRRLIMTGEDNANNI